MLVDPAIADFAIALGREYNNLLNEKEQDLKNHFPLTLEFHTADGVAVRWMEEGLDFYPQDGPVD